MLARAIGIGGLILGSSGGLAAMASASTPVTPIYNSIPSGNVPSLPSAGPEAYSFSELGDQINLAPTSEAVKSVTVMLNDWACQNWAANPSSTVVCTTTPGSSFAIPITLNLYT